MGRLDLTLSNSLIFFIRTYQVVFPSLKTLFGIQGQCRHSLSCSEFTAQAVHEQGAIVGGWSGMKRILSCHPFN